MKTFNNVNKILDIEPIPMKAGDIRVLVNGKPISEDFRIISEGNYQKLHRYPADVGIAYFIIGVLLTTIMFLFL
jgi:hypothetical protein